MAEKHSFGAEVDNFVGSLRAISCSNKEIEIFLWELICNATGALYKLRIANVFDKIELDANEFFMHIIPDKTTNTLSIIDSGIGMTKDDLVNLLGRMSSKDVQLTYLRRIEKLRKIAAASYADVSCVDEIMKLCLGFYSVFLVADKVMVTTKHNSDEQYVLETQAPQAGGARGGFFTITRDTSGDSRLGRGTKVTLFLNDGQFEYLEERRLKDLVDKYSKIFRYPISVLVGNNASATKKHVIDTKKKMKQLEKFEGLRKKFEDVLGKNVNKVIVSDRVFELICCMSLNFVFEINPEHPTMEELRKKFESGEDDEGVFEMINGFHQAWRLQFWLHDLKHGTSILPEGLYASSMGPYYRSYDEYCGLN